MANNKKASAPPEEQTKAAETAPEASEVIENGVALEDTALADISGKLVVVSADGGLNLRVGPARSYPVEELLEDGTLLVAMNLPHGAEVSGWALVHTGQRTGWVDVRFLKTLEEAKEE